MISKTKYIINDATIKELFSAARIDGIIDISPLGAGEYNAVYGVKTHNKDYALKIAPANDIPILTYEKNMMLSEIYWYDKMKTHTSISVPQICHSDFTLKIIPVNYFIMEKLPGLHLDEMDFSETEKVESATITAKMAAMIHQVKNDKFGYIQNELYDSWYQAIRAMVKAVINDCVSIGKKTERGEKLLSLIDKHKAVLEKVECCMVNFDIWPANIICTREGRQLKYSWIDPERSFWGDRIFDFVCLEPGTPLADKKASITAYNTVTDKPIVICKDEQIRYAVALGYLALIMEVERYYRYTPSDLGWKRNVKSSAIFYSSAFNTLENKTFY